jgi:hypothetical protein
VLLVFDSVAGRAFHLLGLAQHSLALHTVVTRLLVISVLRGRRVGTSFSLAIARSRRVLELDVDCVRDVVNVAAYRPRVVLERVVA